MRDDLSSCFLDERVLTRASAAPDAPAIGTPHGWTTYGRLAASVEALAGSLQANGVQPGTFVLNLLPNGVPSVVAGLAVQRAGGCIVEVNREWGRACVAQVVARTHARYAIVQTRDAGLLGGDGEWTAHWVVGSGTPRGGAERRDGVRVFPLGEDGAPGDTTHGCRPPARTPGDVALVLYTSASTGAPRGVRITYANIAANTTAIVDYLRLSPADRVMSVLPLSYCYGRSLLHTHLWVGGSIVLDHRFMYPRVVLEALARERCTGFAGVPLTFEILSRKCDPRSIPMPSLRYVTQAGGAMRVPLRVWARDAFSPADFYVMYGQTEATARLAYLPPERFDEKAGSIGIAIPGVELRVVDEDGRAVPPDVTGELVARGASVTSGYLDDPAETAKILKDGWLWTGDLARRDADGYFFIEGRRRVMLKVSGHRFSPTEVEDRLTQHPDVVEACVVGVPDATTGEAVVAFVATARPTETAALRRFCAAALPPYKLPRAVILVKTLPRSTAGKVQRAVLESLALTLP